MDAHAEKEKYEFGWKVNSKRREEDGSDIGFSRRGLGIELH
jgi:hypothetical protein